jgi:hypothetical protein
MLREQRLHHPPQGGPRLGQALNKGGGHQDHPWHTLRYRHTSGQRIPLRASSAAYWHLGAEFVRATSHPDTDLVGRCWSASEATQTLGHVYWLRGALCPGCRRCD